MSLPVFCLWVLLLLIMENKVWTCLVKFQVKELNHVLEAEKSCRTDLEMYVAVLNTQKSVLQEDTEKLRKELHEGMWPKYANISRSFSFIEHWKFFCFFLTLYVTFLFCSYFGWLVGQFRFPQAMSSFIYLFYLFTCLLLAAHYTVKKKEKLGKLKILRQPASADFWVFSTSCFKFIQQNVEKFPKK